MGWIRLCPCVRTVDPPVFRPPDLWILCPLLAVRLSVSRLSQSSLLRRGPGWRHTRPRKARLIDVSTTGPPDDDPVPPGLVLDLDEAFRVLEALEDARLALREASRALGLQDELATVIRMLHGRLGFDEGGVS